MPMVTDIIHNRPSISHQHSELYSLNALYSDGHVSNCNDQAVFDNLIALDGSDVWTVLDGGIPDLHYYDMAIYTVFRAIGP
jgi:prepilin-type processing-associated H-X9-DG protein